MRMPPESLPPQGASSQDEPVPESMLEEQEIDADDDGYEYEHEER